MKKTILFFALILGMSGLAVAQTCGTGGGYSNYGNDYYYNSNTNGNIGYGSLGVINARWKGYFDRHQVVDARLLRTGRQKVTIEYTFDNGDVLEVQAKRLRGNGHAYGNNRNGRRVGNNYQYNSNRNFGGGDFEIHCANLNGRELPVKFGTLSIEDGSGRRARTHLDMEVGRRGSFRGTVRAFK